MSTLPEHVLPAPVQVRRPAAHMFCSPAHYIVSLGTFRRYVLREQLGKVRRVH
jgi:hypothetical protein